MSAEPSTASASDASLEAAQAQRVRAALARVQQLFAHSLQAGLERSFDELERHLQQLTEHMPEGEERRQWLLLLQTLPQVRHDATARMLVHLAEALRGLGEPAQAGAARAAVTVLDELGAWAPLARQARNVESGAREALCLLGVRFGAMAGVPALPAASLPIGPRQFCRFLRRSCEQIELEAELIHALCPIFGRAWMSQLPRLYEDANALLAGAGVLPNLPRASSSPVVAPEQTQTPRLAPAPMPSPVATATPAPAPALATRAPPAPAPSSSMKQGPAPAAAAQRAPATVNPAIAAKVAAEPVLPPRFLQGGAPDLKGFARPLTGWPKLAWKGTQPSESDAAGGADTQLRDWYQGACRELAARRARRLAAETATDASARIARAGEIQAALAAMQAHPLTLVSLGAQRVLPTLAHARQDLLLRLQQKGEDGPVRLRSTDEDTFELVGHTIASMLHNLPAAAPARELAARLQIAILRVALRDTDFFLERGHPARCFLTAVVEYAGCWLEGDAGDADTVARIAALVERVIAQFNGELEAFESGCAEFAAWRTSAERKAQLAERRHIEAAAGRERLDAARNEARAAIGQCLSRGNPTPLVRVLLEGAWTQVLALALLREGRGGPMGASCLAAAERLVSAFGGAGEAPGARIELAEEAFLRQTLAIGLAKVGYHAGDIQLILERLFSDDPGSHAGEDLAGLLHPLRAAAAAGDGEAMTGVAGGSPAAPARPAETRELPLRDMIRALPAGTWLEFVIDASGRTARRKLARLSPGDGRGLLLNLRGAKIAEQPVEALARAIARGHARVLAGDAELSLERVTPGAAQPAPA